MKFLVQILMCISALLLAACGGGGGSAGLSGLSSATSTNTSTVSLSTPTLILSLQDSSGNSLTSLSTNTVSKIKAMLLDANKKPIQGKLISLAVANSNMATLGATSALTDSSGVALVDISVAPGAPKGATSVQGSVAFDGVSPIQASVEFAVPALPVQIVLNSPTLSISLLDTQGGVINALSAAGGAKVKAVLLDSSKNPLQGKIITFAVANSSMAILGASSGLTDSSGTAIVDIAVAPGASKGATSVQATAIVEGNTVKAGVDFSVPALPSAQSYVASVNIKDANNANVTTINSIGTFRVNASILDVLGQPVANKLVNFTISNGLAVLASSTALTNNQGIAIVDIRPTTNTGVGAANIKIDAVINGAGVTANLDFSVTPNQVVLSPLSAANTTIASGGNTSIMTTATIAGLPPTVPVSVVFSASCGRINSLPADTTGGVSITANGVGAAQVSYDAVTAGGKLCAGNVTVNASTAGGQAVNVALTIAAPKAASVVFNSAIPSRIFVAGSGAAERSEVSFTVLSVTGNPLPNSSLEISILTNPGGLGIGSSGSVQPVTVLTDSSGVAKVSVFSGRLPGPVKLRAALSNDSSIFTESQFLSVASGPASQRFMSVAVSTFNIEGWAIDGTPTKITARVADRQGNAVTDGTVINFTAEGGQVASSCATQRVGDISSCSVDFISQNPRTTGGRVSVMAFLDGTKDYIDNNFDNVYTPGIDTLINIGDAFRDDNENGLRDPGEFTIARGATGTCSALGAGAIGGPAIANTCDLGQATTVRQQVVILFSSSEALVTKNSLSTSGFSFQVRSADNPLLPMPQGTTVKVEASGGSCSVDKTFGSPVVNVQPGIDPSTDLSTTLAGTLKTCASGHTLIVTVTSPSNLAISQFFVIP